MLETVFWISILLREEQSAKAYWLIAVTPLGIVMLSKEVQFLKDS